MHALLVQIEPVVDLAITALLLMSVLIWGYSRLVFRWIPLRRLAVMLAWVASIATVYGIGWSMPARQAGMLRAFPLASLLPLIYFFWRRPT